MTQTTSKERIAQQKNRSEDVEIKMNISRQKKFCSFENAEDSLQHAE